MPKIRDLGINTIPITMRPPEIGPGGGLYACDDHSHKDQTSACGEASCDGDKDEQSGCPDASCFGQEHSACPDASCKPKPPSPPSHHHSAFNPDAIAQLRQQLEIHIGT